MSKQYRIIVDGLVYETGIRYMKLTRPLFDKFGVGNVCSSKLELTYYPTSAPSKAARVDVEYRNEGDTDWKPLGVFFIDVRSKPVNGCLSLVCFDAMVKLDCDYDREGVIWEVPPTMVDMVNWIAAWLDVDVDPRTAIFPYPMELLNGLTIRQILGYIGAANGGNWTLTAENKLLLIPAFTITLPDHLVDENGEDILTDGGLIFV